MEVVMALVSILAIIAIVLVAGGLIAFIGHMVLGAFDFNKSGAKAEPAQSLDYTQFKEKEAEKEASYKAEYDFEEINKSKAEKEKLLLEKESLDIYALDEDDDSDLEEIESRLRQSKPNSATEEPKVEQTKAEEPAVAAEVEEPEIVKELDDDDDLDLDDLLSEISDEVIEEERAESDNEVKMSDELNSYNIDEMLRKAEEELDKIEEDFDDVEEDYEVQKTESKEISEVAPIEIKEQYIKEELTTDDAMSPADFDEEALEEDDEEIEELTPKTTPQEDTVGTSNSSMALAHPISKQALRDAMEQNTEQQKLIENKIGNVLQKIETVSEKKTNSSSMLLLNDVHPEIQQLKAELAELKRELEIARATKVEIIAFDMTEEECMQKIEILEERLKNAKKDYKINMKEYRPLKKVMNDLERYQTKLRRKEAIVAKKKVALYGVNNYVDIDKEKAEKLANELELLDGLRLSVNHCEEVINANKDRFPILEHSNQILESQIGQLEYDLEQAQRTLKKIRERNGGGQGNNGGTGEITE